MVGTHANDRVSMCWWISEEFVMVAGGNDAGERGGGIVCSRLAYRYQTYHNPRFLDIAEHRACSPRHNWSCCNSLHPGFPIGLLPLRILWHIRVARLVSKCLIACVWNNVPTKHLKIDTALWPKRYQDGGNACKRSCKHMLVDWRGVCDVCRW